MSARFDITIDKGASFSFRFKPMTETPDGIQTPWDLTDIEFVFQTHEASNHTIVYDAPLEIDDDGYVVLVLTPEETVAYYSNRRYTYVLDATYLSGDIKRILKGHLYCDPLGVY